MRSENPAYIRIGASGKQGGRYPHIATTAISDTARAANRTGRIYASGILTRGVGDQTITVRTINDIWQGVLQGDPPSWRTIVERYEALVFTVARRAGLSRADAEDCAQHTWLSLYRTRHTIKDPVALPAWLIRTTHRRAVRVATQQARVSPLHSEVVEAHDSRIPDEELLALERQAHLELAIGQLDERCQYVMKALFFSAEEKTYAQIARDLGIPPNSFGPTRARCLKKLEKILRDLGYA